MCEYYLKINELPESCTKCFAFSSVRDGWCMAKSELQVEMHITDIHPECPIRCVKSIAEPKSKGKIKVNIDAKVIFKKLDSEFDIDFVVDAIKEKLERTTM